MRQLVRRRGAVLAVAAVLAALTSCSGVGEQAKQGDRKGYVAGDGTIEKLATERRAAPVTVQGTTLTGVPWSSTSVRGKVVVLNVWGSWCAPCMAEMPDLQKVWASHQKGTDVTFMGLNVRESAASAQAFVETEKVTFPSLADDGGKAIAALQGKARDIPTTLVLDRQGRIAARVSGPVRESTLVGLIADTVAERS